MFPANALSHRCEIRIRLFSILTLLALAPMPLTAEWLLLRDGSEIETTGRWQLSDGLVTFGLSTQRGLFSLRSSEVDLAGSEALTRRRTEEAERLAAAPPTPRPARRAPVLVLTDRDVRKVKRSAAAPAAAGPGAATTGEAPAATAAALPHGLEVVNWRRTDVAETGGFMIEGELRNRGDRLAVGLELEISLTVGGGSVVTSRSARLSATTLAPGQRSRFRVEFSDPVDFDRVEFQIDPEVVAWVEILGPHGAVDRDVQSVTAS